MTVSTKMCDPSEIAKLPETELLEINLLNFAPRVAHNSLNLIP